jgi:hypothetical protein
MDFAVSDQEVSPGKDNMALITDMRFVFNVVMGVPRQGILRGIHSTTEMAREHLVHFKWVSVVALA